MSECNQNVMESLRLGPVTDIVASAERILVPKSSDASQCWDLFTEITGIEIPQFVDRKLIARSGGRTFWKVRGDDMPRLITKGLADIAVTSTESRVEYGEPGRLLWQKLGAPICRYSILADENMLEQLQERCTRSSRYPIAPYRIPATYPKLLDQIAAARDLPVYADPGMRITGSGEAMPALFGTGLVADRVSSGRTATENELLEAVKLCDLYPELIWRPSNENI